MALGRHLLEKSYRGGGQNPICTRPDTPFHSSLSIQAAAEISNPNLLIFPQRPCIAREHNVSTLENVRSVGDTECRVRILLDQENGQPIVSKLLREFKNGTDE